MTSANSDFVLLSMHSLNCRNPWLFLRLMRKIFLFRLTSPNTDDLNLQSAVNVIIYFFYPPLLCSLRARCMTMSSLSGPYICYGSACCFCALQTDAPSNLFLHGWAVGVFPCHFMASTHTLPMPSTVIGVCVCVRVCVRTFVNICHLAFGTLHSLFTLIFCLIAFNLHPRFDSVSITV